MEAHQIIIRPVVTEKAAPLMERKIYTFKVHTDANKIQIGKAVEALFPGVEVGSVRTMVVRGKARRQFTKRGAVAGRRSGWKKAVVVLKAGEINYYENAY
jgi:large subunit ribosomal protein L23